MSITTNFSPENLNSLGGVFYEVLKNYLLDLEFCAPAIVDKYDRVKNIVTVLPSIKMVDVNGDSKQRLPINIPVLNICGGKIFVNFPIEKGDTGWIIGSDRNPELFLKSLEASEPLTNDMFQYSFGFFIPDKISGANIVPEDDGYLVIGTMDGNTKILIKDGEIKIKTGNKVEIETPTTNIKGNVSVTGSISATGNISSDAVVIGASNVLGGGKSMIEHTHQVIAVGAPTGAPL